VVKVELLVVGLEPLPVATLSAVPPLMTSTSWPGLPAVQPAPYPADAVK
jgi:hypothetical protein